MSVPRFYSGIVTTCFDCPGVLARSTSSFCKKYNFKALGKGWAIPDWCPLPLETEKEKNSEEHETFSRSVHEATDAVD